MLSKEHLIEVAEYVYERVLDPPENRKMWLLENRHDENAKKQRRIEWVAGDIEYMASFLEQRDHPTGIYT